MTSTQLITRQPGFTLIELMITLVIAAFLLLGTMTMTTRTIIAYDKEAQVTKMNEIARFALDYISRRVRDSGYWGCMEHIEDINNNLNGQNNQDDDLAIFKKDINGKSNVPIDMSGPGVTPTSYGGDTSDILLVHNVQPRGNPVEVTAAPATTTDPLTVTADAPLDQGPNSPLNTGNIVLVANCASGDISQITKIDGDQISFEPSTNPPPGNSVNGLSTIYDQTSYVYPLDTHIFSIAKDDKWLGLFETSTDFPDGIELIENVERLNVLYGEDTNSNGSPNYYVQANDVTNMDNVVSLNIQIVVVSDNDQMVPEPMTIEINGESVTPNDTRLRKVYSTTISRRNWI